MVSHRPLLRYRQQIVILLAVIIGVLGPAASGAVPFDHLVILIAFLLVVLLISSKIERPKSIISWFVFTFVLWLAVVVCQLLPPDIDWFAPTFANLEFETLGVAKPFFWLSDFPGFFYAFGTVLAGALAFWIGLSIGQTPKNARRFLTWLIFVSSLAVTFYLIMYNIDMEWLNFTKREFGKGSFTGGFVNRNSAATWLGSLLILSLALYIASWREISSSSFGGYNFFDKTLPKMIKKLAIPSIFLLVILIALFLTNSRGGTASTIVALATFTILVAARHAGKYKIATLFFCTVAVVLVLGVLENNHEFNARLTRGAADDPRWALFGAVAELIIDHPWLGVGLGGFQSVFQSYKPDQLAPNLLWDRAHNTPLQMAAELGLPMAFFVLLLWFLLMYYLIRQSRVLQSQGILPLAGFSIMLQNSLHSLVDFSLQLPGYLVFFCMVIGSITASTTMKKVKRKVRKVRHRDDRNLRGEPQERTCFALLPLHELI